MVNQNMDLAYKGDWSEQTAEFAIACGDKETAARNYARAISSYENGGWFLQALNVARKIGDSEKIKDLEGKLK